VGRGGGASPRRAALKLRGAGFALALSMSITREHLVFMAIARLGLLVAACGSVSPIPRATRQAGKPGSAEHARWPGTRAARVRMAAMADGWPGTSGGVARMVARARPPPPGARAYIGGARVRRGELGRRAPAAESVVPDEASPAGRGVQRRIVLKERVQ